ncbi:MAG: helix-turn-helix domain-containing protein [Rhodopila sp.]|nr:helix-turn-helix domain-containing protein [Rhodopila sp.]
MSVSLAVTAKFGQAASRTALSPMPWGMPALPEEREASGFELTGAVLHFGPERQIYAEGDEARSFYKVVSGVVRTCRFLSDGRRQIDAFHVAGDVFGFEAGADHRLAAEAVSDCTVIAYRRRGLETIVTHDDRLGSWFFSHAMTTMARAREHSLLLGRGSAAQKIAAFLLETAARESNDSVIDLAMSRQDIAGYLGLTIETVSRTLSQLERDRTIALPTARRVVLKDHRALRALAS